MDVTDIRVFAPSKDYETSKAFYSEIGFKPEYVSEQLTLFQNGECSFFLQDFYEKTLAKNFMLQVCVSDIKAAFEICNQSQHKTKISQVQQERWGQLFFLWGPVGELLQITQLNSD
jgi:predicted lactoylglutathione lyase